MLFSLLHHITLVSSCFFGIERNTHIKFVSYSIFLIYQQGIRKRNTCNAINERMSIKSTWPFLRKFWVCHKQMRMLFILLSKLRNKVHILCLINAKTQPTQWKIKNFSRAEFKHGLLFSVVITSYRGEVV